MQAALAALPEQAEAGTRLTHAEVATNNQMFRELTAELADTKRQLASKERLLSDTCETIQPMRWRCTELQAALESLLEAVEIDGTLLHSEACGCETCEPLANARRMLKSAAPPTSPTECERLREENADEDRIKAMAGSIIAKAYTEGIDDGPFEVCFGGVYWRLRGDGFRMLGDALTLHELLAALSPATSEGGK